MQEKKKKLKEDNELQQIPEDLIDVEIEKITINPKNEGKKWKYIEETYPVSQFFSKNFSQNYFTIDASEEVSKIQKELMNIVKKGVK